VETLHAVLDKYLQCSHIKRASLMSATLAGIRLRSLSLSAEQFAALQSVCTAMLWSVVRPDRRESGTRGMTPWSCDRKLLWRFGISGDLPILLVSVGVIQGAGLLRSLAQALRLWVWSGLACDLVVLDFEVNSYVMPLQREIAAIRERLASDAVTSTTPTALHLLRALELSSDEMHTLHTLARLHIHADGRPLTHHLQEWVARHDSARQERVANGLHEVSRAHSRGPVMATTGAFDANTGAYAFAVSDAARTPRPWSNVLANPEFGSVLTETGGGFTWATNSRLHQITSWSNDPVTDPSSEWLLLQDTRSNAAWSLTPNAWSDATARYQVTHGQGNTTISHAHDGIDVSVSWCVDPEQAIKSVHIALHNTTRHSKRLRLLGMVEWIMGSTRSDRNTCHTHVQQISGPLSRGTRLMCTQRAQEGGFGDTTAFLHLAYPITVDQTDVSWTCDRREFFNTLGQLVLPERLGQRCGDGLDPCAALSLTFQMAPDARVEWTFTLGHAPTIIAAHAMDTWPTCNNGTNNSAESATRWNTLLGACTVHTPDPLLDVLVNRWFLYQAVSCRLWAKAGFYQAGGATGFRDQLQDAMALVWSAPALLRRQIVLCASHQFAQGDVQHWWHDPTGAGVRTHFSDDLLWLPYALAHYLRATGDNEILEQRAHFLEGPAIAEGAEDAYYTPTASTEDATVWEHAARTLDASLRVGAHGLPLMGSGDWNDGMNAVGREGLGESVWLGWFLCQIVGHMAPLAHQRGDVERALRWEAAATACKQALVQTGWDGQWFRRAYFDNGEALGSSGNAECQIDLIAQAWSVLSGVATLPMQAMAMDAVDEHLVDIQAGLVKLLSPPLQSSQPSAGYIQAYPPGVRENGGQYAHAAVWAMMAQARLHTSGATVAANGVPRCDLAYRYFTYLSPAHRSANKVYGATYGLEPYAMAADVYGCAPYTGQGGWSWYTGAAGLMHRAVMESIFGLHQEASTLSFTPCLPSHWNTAELTLSREAKRLHFILLRTAPGTAPEVALQHQARILWIGEALAWQELPDGARYLIPLPLPLQTSTTFTA
jgi:cyclic beta-1,2-glucan synthetase